MDLQPRPATVSSAATASGNVPKALPKRRASAPFGDARFNRVWEQAVDYIHRHNLTRLSQYEETADGLRRLTICNLWRMERQGDDRDLRLFVFNLQDRTWQRTFHPAGWPQIPLYPRNRRSDLHWWRDIIRLMLWQALAAAGYHELPQTVRLPATDDGKPCRERHDYQLFGVLYGRFIGREESVGWDGEVLHPASLGKLDDTKMKRAAMSLRRDFYRHILDREVHSALLAINYGAATFTRYLACDCHRAGLLKVAREHRNLLPLLPGIDPAQWGRDDLFSRKLWVRDGRKSTALERRPVRPERTRTHVAYGYNPDGIFAFDQPDWRPLCAFDDVAAWNWLRRAPLTVVRAWFVHGAHEPDVIAALAAANVSLRLPARVYAGLMKGFRSRCDTMPAVKQQQLLRCYLVHCPQLWQQEGVAARKAQDRNEIGDIADWLTAEGLEQGHPHKQSTWAALKRRSDDWHRRVAIARTIRYDNNGQPLAWQSLLPQTEIDGIVFTPLEDAAALAAEGAEMHHCIAGYTMRCHGKGYRAWAVCEPDGRRSTLGIERRNGRYRIEQHRGPHNGEVSAAAKKAGKKLLAQYHQAWDISIGKPNPPRSEDKATTAVDAMPEMRHAG